MVKFPLIHTLSNISSWETFLPAANATAFIPLGLARSFCVSLVSVNIALVINGLKRR